MIAAAIALVATVSSADTVRLYAGYVTQVRCTGRLLVSAVGSETLIRLEALPRELGCGVLLKPLVGAGRTNLVLETSTGTVERIVEVHGGRPLARDLTVFVGKGAP